MQNAPSLTASRLPTAPPMAFAGRRLVDRVIAAALALAGGIHAVLIPDHFAESLLFGAVFVAIAAMQLWLAVALVRAPGPRTYRAALLLSVALVAVWAGTRFVTPPTGAGPEEVDAWGVVAAGLELGAAFLLATTVPATTRRPRSRALWAAAGALGFSIVYLLASGSAGSGSAEPGAPLVETYTLYGDFSLLVPGLVVLLDGGRVFLTLAWSTAVFLPITAGLLAAQIFMALDTSACDARLRARRRGVIAVTPALFAAPVCCGAPLLAFLGTGALLTLTAITPVLLIATSLLLGAGTWRVARERRRARRPAGHQPDLRFQRERGVT